MGKARHAGMFTIERMKQAIRFGFVWLRQSLPAPAGVQRAGVTCGGREIKLTDTQALRLDEIQRRQVEEDV